MLQLDLRELFLPSSRANTPIIFFLKQRVTIKYFKHWLILTAKGLLQSSEFHRSPISREPDIIQVSWRRKGENKDHLLFHQITQISSQWSANKRLGKKKISCICPNFGKVKFCQCWEGEKKKKSLFTFWQSGKLSSLRDDSGITCRVLM